MHLTEEAQLNKPKLQRWLDEFGERYSQAIGVVSAVAALVGPFVFEWPFIGTPGARGSIYMVLGLMVAVSSYVLAVAPLAYATAISTCASKGILLKGGHALDALASPGEPECTFYIKIGECKFGPSGKFHHPLNRPDPSVKLTLAGLPRREGEATCPFYMKTGTCKYGATCKFDHPPPGEAVAKAVAMVVTTEDNLEDEDKMGSGNIVGAKATDENLKV